MSEKSVRSTLPPEPVTVLAPGFPPQSAALSIWQNLSERERTVLIELAAAQLVARGAPAVFSARELQIRVRIAAGLTRGQAEEVQRIQDAHDQALGVPPVSEAPPPPPVLPLDPAAAEAAAVRAAQK